MKSGRKESDPGGPGDDRGRLLAERKRFSRFDEQDSRSLSALGPLFEAQADGLVEAFYNHLMQFEVLRPLLEDPATVARLKIMQRKYLLSLSSGNYDEQYASSRYRIGHVHQHIGLSPQWYLGTYGMYLDLLMPLIQQHYAGRPDLAMQSNLALTKLLVLDMQLVLDAYYEIREKRAVERSEKLAAVGELAASIAHEVRNPLAGMKGALQILRRDRETPAKHLVVLEESLGQIDRLENLVRDLLAFATPRPRVSQLFDLHELLERHARQAEQQSGSVALTVRRFFDTDAGRLIADPQQIEQVVLNLVQNACQAMTGGGVLTLTTRLQDGWTTILIQDTGPGIPADVRPDIFVPFFTTRHRGSGLGLPIVRKIVEAHGGTIEIESQPRQGTSARVKLPYGEAP